MSLPTHDEIMADEFGREVRVECTQCWKVERIVEDTRKKRGYWDEPEEYVCTECRDNLTNIHTYKRDELAQLFEAQPGVESRLSVGHRIWGYPIIAIKHDADGKVVAVKVRVHPEVATYEDIN